MYGAFPYMTPNIAMNAVPLASGLSGVGANAATSAGTSLLGKINWSTLLSNAQKTLNVVNQAVPLYYQVKPVFKNIRAIGRIGKEFSKISNNNNNNTVSTNTSTIINNETNNANNEPNIDYNSINEEIPTPQFFL